LILQVIQTSISWFKPRLGLKKHVWSLQTCNQTDTKFVEKPFGHEIKFGEKILWSPTPLKVN